MDIALESVIRPGMNWPLTGNAIISDSLLSAFVSEESLQELLYQFKIKIVQKLIPGLNKPGYEESK